MTNTGGTIGAIKTALSIPRVAAEAGHRVEAGGRSRCIIHGGDNPHSLQVSADGRRARCWACGWRGDVIDAAEALFKLTRRDAIDLCAQLAGLPTHRPARPATIRRAIRAQRQAAANDMAVACRQQGVWAEAVEHLLDVNGSIGVMESIWSRDPQASGALAQRALDELSTLYLERDQAEADVEERWRDLNALNSPA